ncbi:MAG: hypothetical protein ACETWM_09660 [Candidatus Lokiarchaeia archaeon]
MKKTVKRKILLSMILLTILGVISLGFSLLSLYNQPGTIYYSNQLLTKSMVPKTTSGVVNLTLKDTLYQASNKILHLWPCHISQGQYGIVVYSNEGTGYNLTIIEPGVQPKQRWQISFSSSIEYCWVDDYDGDSYDELAVKVVGGNLTIYDGSDGSEVTTLDTGSRVITSVDWDNNGENDILLVSPPLNNGTHIFLNISFIDDVTSPVLDNSTYYLNQTNGFNFAVAGNWDLSSPGVEVVLMSKTGNSIYNLRSNDWVRSKTEMVNASVITLPGGATFSNRFDFRSPYFAFYMDASEIGVFYNNSIHWTIQRINSYIKLIQLDTGVRLLTTYPLSYWSKNYTIYNALTGEVEHEGQNTLTASHTMSDNKNRLFTQWESSGYPSNYGIYQTDFSSSQPASHEALLDMNFYSRTLYIMDSVFRTRITVFGNEINDVRFFTYLRDFNGDGKTDMLAIYGWDYRILQLYSMEPIGLPSSSELFFNLYNLASYLSSMDLKALGLGLGILIMGIALASVYYIRKRSIFKR